MCPGNICGITLAGLIFGTKLTSFLSLKFTANDIQIQVFYPNLETRSRNNTTISAWNIRDTKGYINLIKNKRNCLTVLCLVQKPLKLFHTKFTYIHLSLFVHMHLLIGVSSC